MSMKAHVPNTTVPLATTIVGVGIVVIIRHAGP